MVYTPTTWAHDTVFTTTNLNNMETQYDEGYTYYVAHTHDTEYYTRTEMETIVLTPGSESGFWYAGNDGTGSGCDGDKIYTSSGNLDWGSLSIAGAPDGLIVIWGKSVASIPSGWHLCDGTSGTINLVNKYVLAAGDTGYTYVVGNTGGSKNNQSNDILSDGSGNSYSTAHAITIAEMPSHSHAWLDMYCTPIEYHNADGGGGLASNSQNTSRTTGSAGSGTAHTHTGTIASGSTENRPPTKAYCYIQKIP